MSIEDRMTIDERRRCLRRMQERYLQAGRREQAQLLDEMEAITELDRKSLIGAIRQPNMPASSQVARSRLWCGHRRRRAHHRRDNGLCLRQAFDAQPVLAGVLQTRSLQIGPVVFSNIAVVGLAIGVVLVPVFARVARASVLAEVREDYIMAARSFGAGTRARPL